MKNIRLFSLLLCVLTITVILLTQNSCNKDEEVTNPTVTTTSASSITAITAISGGSITDDGSSAITARGVCWRTITNPTIANDTTKNGSGIGTYSSNLTGLNVNRTYYVRAYATNAVGTTYGNEQSFTTDDGIPTLTTTSITVVTTTSAISGGNITDDGGLTVTARGVCWSTSNSPTISDSFTTNGTGTGSFTNSLTGLSVNTTYYVRAYSTNADGTMYGNTERFITYYGTISDYDGNKYYTIQIGSQIWMAENLKTTHYANSDEIPNGTGVDDISGETDPKYWFAYNNDLNNINPYGRLYTWYTVTDNRNVCPDGWHVPTDSEWTTLTNYLGGESVVGGKLKETGTTHWAFPNMLATNETGFTALPAGLRYFYGPFYGLSIRAYFWSTTEYVDPDFDDSYAWYRTLGYNHYEVGRASLGSHKNYGLSVRCIKD